jgi:hypothetical protein
MHVYSTSSNERKVIPFYLALIIIAVVFLLNHWTAMPTWLPVPSVVAIYGILFGLFNRFIWKWKITGYPGIVKTPNLNGVWNTVSRSSFNGFSKDYAGTLEIHQTWTEISLFFDGEKASSQSVMAAVSFINQTRFTLEWEYLSRKKSQFADKDYMHYGLTRLQLESRNKQEVILKGDYFTDSHRQYFGEMIIKKGLVSLPKGKRSY